MFFGIIGVYAFILFGGEQFNETKQEIHVHDILSKNILDPLKSDLYYGKLMDTMYNYDLCPILNNYVRKTHKWSPTDPIYKVPSYQISHNFSKRELKSINSEYIKMIYTPINFPYTYRPKNVFININNKTANELYYNYCKNYFRGLPSDVVPYYFCIGMILAVTLHFFGFLK
jgi:hypothetical protein